MTEDQLIRSNMKSLLGKTLISANMAMIINCYIRRNDQYTF